MKFGLTFLMFITTITWMSRSAAVPEHVTVTKDVAPAILVFSWQALLGAGVASVEARQSVSTPPKSPRPAATHSKSPSKPAAAQPSGKKEHTFRGTVEKVDRERPHADRQWRECAGLDGDDDDDLPRRQS